MTTVVRIALIVVLAAQAWWAWNVTRYEAHFRAGVRAWDAAEVDAVRGHFEDATGLIDDDALAWAWLGDSYLYAFDWSGLRDIDPQRGVELLDGAWHAYAESVRRCPPYAWSWGGLAGVANRRVQLDDRVSGIDITRLARLRDGVWEPTRVMALAAGELAVWLKPSGFQELDILAEIHAAAGDRDHARELLEKSARTMPAPSYHSWGTGPRLQNDLYRALLVPLDEGIAEAPEFDRSMLSLDVGLFAVSQFDPVGAVRYFDAAAAEARNDYQRYRALWERSGVLPELGRYEDAIEDLEATLTLPFDRRSSYRRLAVLNEELGRWKKACATFLRTTSLPDVAPEWLVRASRACVGADEIEIAVAILRGGMHSPKRDPKLARTLVEILKADGASHSARGLLDRWIERYPDEPRFVEWRTEFFPEDEDIGTGS